MKKVGYFGDRSLPCTNSLYVQVNLQEFINSRYQVAMLGLVYYIKLLIG